MSPETSVAQVPPIDTLSLVQVSFLSDTSLSSEVVDSSSNDEGFTIVVLKA